MRTFRIVNVKGKTGKDGGIVVAQIVVHALPEYSKRGDKYRKNSPHKLSLRHGNADASGMPC